MRDHKRDKYKLAVFTLERRPARSPSCSSIESRGIPSVIVEASFTVILIIHLKHA